MRFNPGGGANINKMMKKADKLLVIYQKKGEYSQEIKMIYQEKPGSLDR
jgi:tRNA1(Val) A37 N6-methylase TrmN6